MGEFRPKTTKQYCFQEQIYYQSHGQIGRSYLLSSFECPTEHPTENSNNVHMGTSARDVLLTIYSQFPLWGLNLVTLFIY